MKFRRRPRGDVSVELTPLIDVVFLLLIFFMVSTTFIRETQLKIDLPEAEGAPQEVEEGVVELSVSAAGEYAVNNRLLVNGHVQTILRALREVSGGDHSRRLIITADASAPHESVVRVMDAAGRLGMTRISITTRSPESDE
ncbi:MAG: biopolymer transporter ExbD [Gammaproteobacteria bacterium]|nr:biopolymer transporter ExbD [Gammaproteobacteria bacterium]